MRYVRPISITCPARPDGALPMVGGPLWFDRVELLERGQRPRILPVSDVPPELLDRLTAPRPAFAGVTLDQPRLMGVLNVTPDSFSDGGRFLDPRTAQAQARAMIAAGADILDIGGESTRPGAAEAPVAEEIARTAPVIAAVRDIPAPISIDTRKAAVARAALDAGAAAVNDVSALTFDPALGPLVAAANVPVILMHAQGTPATMQVNPTYYDVLLDVFDTLETRIRAAEMAGIARSRIVVDPGIGFGKTLGHNLDVLARVSLFHALGVPVLVGASRKRFIGTIAGVPEPADRMPGSVAVALAAVAQGIQILRVHDVGETKQALALWQAATRGGA
jgi:dihydropteroate synthase